MKLSKSGLVEKQAKKAFAECDVDGTGEIDAKELHVGLLIVYDKLNKILPVHVKIPSHTDVQALLKKHDADGSGHLNAEEFHDCVKSLLGMNEQKAKFTDSIPFKVISRMAFKMALFPLAAFAIKKLLVEVGGEGAEKVPSGLLAFGVEGLYKLGKAAALTRGTA